MGGGWVEGVGYLAVCQGREIKTVEKSCRVSNPQPTVRMQPGMAMNAAQHTIVNLLKTFFCLSVFVSVCVFNVWPKTTLLPVWPRDAKRVDTLGENTF